MKSIYLLSIVTLLLLSSYTLLVSSNQLNNEPPYNSKRLLYKRKLLRKRGGPSIPVIHRGDAKVLKKINESTQEDEGVNTISESDGSMTTTPQTTPQRTTTSPPNDQANVQTLKKSKPKSEEKSKSEEEKPKSEDDQKTESSEKESEDSSGNDGEVKTPIDSKSVSNFKTWVTGYVSFFDVLKTEDGKKKNLPKLVEGAVKSIDESIKTLQKELGCDLGIAELNKRQWLNLRKRGGPSIPVTHRGDTTTSSSTLFKKANVPDQEGEDTTATTTSDDDTPPPKTESKKKSSKPDSDASDQKSEGEEGAGENSNLITIPIHPEDGLYFKTWVEEFVTFINEMRSYGSKDGKKKRIPDAAERAVKAIIEGIGTLEDQLDFNLHEDLDNLPSSSD